MVTLGSDFSRLKVVKNELRFTGLDKPSASSVRIQPVVNSQSAAIGLQEFEGTRMRGIAVIEQREEVERIREDPLHRFGVPWR